MNGGNNIEYNPNGTMEEECFGGNNAVIRSNPEIQALADNGGQTKTMALAETSVAINAGDDETCTATDQRGEAREGTCDIGAYEFIPTTESDPEEKTIDVNITKNPNQKNVAIAINKVIEQNPTDFANLKAILDATDEDKIGDIIFLKQIFLSDECEIECEFIRGYVSEHSSRPDRNTFYVSGGDKLRTKITICKRNELKPTKRIEIAEKFSKKLGVRIAEPLVV